MSDRLAQLVNNVKDLIQDGTKSTDQCIKDIDNEIDTKENQIRDLFSDNIDSVIQHFLRHHQTLFHHKRLELDCQQFAKHVEKGQKLNAYDEQQIQKSQSNLQFMKGVRNKLVQFRGHIKMAKKAAINIKEEKYNNAIKIISQYKKSQSTLDTPLKGVLPILEKKVEEHLQKLLQSFWQENRKKMLDIGRNCFSKMSSNLQQKMNIYQIFFGQNMAKSAIMNRSAISSFRYTVIERQNSSRIMKTSQQTVDYFNKVMVRVSVEMSTLKKVKVMVVELQDQGVFNEMLKGSMKEYLKFVEDAHSCEKEDQFVDMLSQLVGLLLIKRQVCAFFDIKIDERVFLIQMYIFIGRQIKSLSFILRNIDIVLVLKQHFLIFHRLLDILSLGDNSQNYNTIISDLLKSYNERNLNTYQLLSRKQISNDNLTHYSTSDSQKETLIRQMLDLGSQEFRFTSYVLFVIEYFMKTYNEVTKIIDESDINHSAILHSLRELYEKALKVYGAEVLAKNQHYQIIQGEVNLIYINKTYHYILRQLQLYHGVVVSNKTSDQYEQLVVRLTRNILQVIRQKLTTLMQDYKAMQPTHLNESSNQFVQWSLQFLNNITIFMKNINCPNSQEITIQTMREMCDLYWQYLHGLKEINLIIIYNLDLDLSFIYRYCGKHFNGNVAILDRFKSLREFYALMLTNNVQDYLDTQKRMLSYSNLNVDVVVDMLRKYVQVKSTGGRVRELKKKEVEGVVKKLTAPPPK